MQSASRFIRTNLDWQEGGLGGRRRNIAGERRCRSEWKKARVRSLNTKIIFLNMSRPDEQRPHLFDAALKMSVGISIDRNIREWPDSSNKQWLLQSLHLKWTFWWPSDCLLVINSKVSNVSSSFDSDMVPIGWIEFLSTSDMREYNKE